MSTEKQPVRAMPPFPRTLRLAAPNRADAIALLPAGLARANVSRAVLRVTFWGVLAMLVTDGIGRLVGMVA